MFVHTMSMIVNYDLLKFAFGSQFALGQLIPVNDELRAKVEIAIVNSHRRSVTPFFFIFPESLNDICFSITVCITQRNVSSVSLRKPGLNIDITVIIYGNLTSTSFKTIDHHYGFKILGEE